MRYESYSPSKIKWNPDSPSHWKCDKAKRFFFNPKVINKDSQEDNVLSLTLKGVIRNNKEKPIGLSPEDYSTYQIFQPNELVFKLIDLNNISTSRVGLVPETGIMSSAYIRFSPKNDMNIKYFYYQYFDWYKRNIFNGLGAGVRQTISGSELGTLEILVPPRDEQDQIVQYLDWQVSKINRLISAAKKEIALIKEIEVNQITSAVWGRTSNNNTKQSGILGIGEVPGHWFIRANKRIFKERNEKSETGAETLLSVSRHFGVKPSNELSEDEQYATIKPAESLVGYKIVKKNDLAMNIMRAQNGSYGISDYEGIVSPAYCVYELLPGYNPKYMHYLLKTPQMISIFFAASSGITDHRRRLYADDFLRIKIAVPPLEEQEQIVEQIEKIESTFQGKTVAIEKQIKLLKELRTRLISDVVTGQINVRDVEIPEYEYVSDSSDEEESEDDEEVTELEQDE